MVTLPLVGSALGSSATFSSDLQTASNQTPSVAQINSIRGTSTTSGTGLTQTSTLTQYSVTPLQGQPGTTPAASNDAPPLPTDPMHADSTIDYETASPTQLAQSVPRWIGDATDKLASISIQYQKNSVQSSGANGLNQGGVQGIIMNGYSRFFLQSVVEQNMEKYQVVETFSDFYVFFYGVRPSIYRISGTVLSDPINRWQNDMMYFYQNYFRGTQTANRAAQAVMYYNARQITGFILSLSMQEVAEQNKGIPFSMDFLMVTHNVLATSPDIQALISALSKAKAKTSSLIAAQQALLSPSTPTAQNQVVAAATSNLVPPSLVLPSNQTLNVPKPSLLSGASTPSPYSLL